MSSSSESAIIGVSEREMWVSSCEPFWMGRSVVEKVEMLYWLGSVEEI